MIRDVLYPIARSLSRWFGRYLPNMQPKEFTVVLRFEKVADQVTFERELMRDASANDIWMRPLHSDIDRYTVAGVNFKLECSEDSWARSIPVPKARLQSESSQGFCVAADMWLAGDNSFLGEETVQTLCAKRLADTILKSSELKQAISTLGLTKPSATQRTVLRLSFTGAIVDPGLLSPEPKTSST